MENINDEKLRELGEKLALFAEDGPIHVQWPVAPFQMHVPEFVPSPSVLLQQQFQQQQAAQQQQFQAAAAQIGAFPGYFHYPQSLPQPVYHPQAQSVFPFHHQMQQHPTSLFAPGISANSTQTEAMPFLAVKDAASSPKHQRVPSLGAIDSETNPIAASLLMSFKSIMADDRSSLNNNSKTADQPISHHTHHHQTQPQQVVSQGSQKQTGASGGGHYHGGGGHHNGGKPHHVMLRPHYYSSDLGDSVQQQQQQVAPPPPPPPVQPQVQIDSWSPYNGSMCGEQSGASSRPKFSDVVKKSLSEVATTSGQQSGASNSQSVSRPVTPGPASAGSAGQTPGMMTASVPPSPSLGSAANQVVQGGGGNSLQNANFSLASSRSNLSRNGKPIVVAKVEPMQVSANRLNSTAPTQQAQKPVTSLGDTSKVRRTRSSTTGNSGTTNGQGETGQSQNGGQFGGSIDSVFDTSNSNSKAGGSGGSGNKTSSQGGGGPGEGGRGGRGGHGRMTTTSSLENDSERDDEGRRGDDEDEGEFELEDELEVGGETLLEEVEEAELENLMRHRSTSHRSKATKKAATKKGLNNRTEASLSRPGVFIRKMGSFLAQVGPWIVFLLAKTGSLFRFMLYVMVVQGLGYVLGLLFDALKSCYGFFRRLFPAKVERAELKLSYLALLRQYGLPRPISLPASADATLKRLVQLADADAYTVLGCRFDAKQDDINVRLRQLARLLTQNHKKTQQLEEAGAVFRRICNDIGSREARTRYDCELVASAEFALKRRLAMAHNFAAMDAAGPGLGGLVAFQCYDCGLIHQLYELPHRRQLDARACNRCGPSVLHGCEMGDLWAETHCAHQSVLMMSAATPDGAGGGSTVEQLQFETVRYLTCLLDPPTIYDASDAIPCCKSRFLAKCKLDPNLHTVAYKLELTPKIDEQGQSMRKLPNPTALQQHETEWPMLQVYQVRMVAKFQQRQHDNFSSSSSGGKQQQIDSPLSGASGKRGKKVK